MWYITPRKLGSYDLNLSIYRYFEDNKTRILEKGYSRAILVNEAPALNKNTIEWGVFAIWAGILISFISLFKVKVGDDWTPARPRIFPPKNKESEDETIGPQNRS